MAFRVVVLVSGVGTLLQHLLDAQAEGLLAADVVAVGSDRVGIEGLARAEVAGVPTFVVSLSDCADRQAWDEALSETVSRHEPDLVVLAGFMKLIGAPLLDRYPGRVINTHPALLPSFPGAHGVRDALAYGVRVSGCTIFTVDAGVDTGRIIDQVAVRVQDHDTPETLHARIKVVERALLLDTINAFALNTTKRELA